MKQFIGKGEGIDLLCVIPTPTGENATDARFESNLSYVESNPFYSLVIYYFFVCRSALTTQEETKKKSGKERRTVVG